MSPEPKTAVRLDGLQIDESSGVDRPANGMPGWLVVKAESGPGSRKAAIIDGLRERARALGLAVDDDALDGIAMAGVNEELRGNKFKASDYDDQLKSAASSPKQPPAKTTKATRLTQTVEALAERAAMLGVVLADAALERIAMGALSGTEEDEPFRPGDYDAALRAAGKSPATTPTPLAPQARPTEPAKPATKPRTDQQQTLKEEAHQHLVDRQAAAAVAELRSQGVPPAEATRRAAESVLGGSVTTQAINSLTKSLVEDQGLAPGAARITAARAMGDVLRDRLRKRAGEGGDPGSGTVTGPSTGRAEVASELRIARIWKGFTQAELAEEVGVTSRQVASWEAGHDLPNGLNATRLAGVLDLGIEGARRIAKARGR